MQREPGSGTRSTFERALGAPTTLALQASSAHAVLSAARNGVATAVVSEIAARADLADGTLVAVTTTLDMHRPLRAVWRPQTRLRSPMSDLLSIAAAEGTD